MRIATYNVEWFSALFEGAKPRSDSKWSARHNVTRAQQIASLGEVFRRLDADAVMIIEAPDDSADGGTVLRLEHFAQMFALRARQAILGFSNSTQQEIALLFDPDKLSAQHDPIDGGDVAPRFDRQIKIDLDVDARKDTVVFSKPPLELALQTASGFSFRMIGAHLKSKAPHGAKNDADAMRISIANRRKQLAQSIWLRARIAAHLKDATPLIVLGDLNDGPGLDTYENLFGRSSVEIVLGEDDACAELFDPHAARLLTRKFAAAPTTSRFWIKPENRYLQALLDYVMVSADLRARAPSWRIWHPFDDPECWSDTGLRDALLTASDHFPVSLEIDI